MMEPEFERLVKFVRNSLVEEEYSGLILLMDKKGIKKRVGFDNNYKFYQRSCMKPLQFALHIDEGIVEEFKLTLPEVAVCCASHTGDVEHQKIVRSILNKIGLDESYLLCGKHAPLSIKEQERIILNNLESLPIHNNCSGKHSAMLALCVHKGWSLNDYLEDNHPLNQAVIDKVLTLCEVEKNDYVRSKDGCGLPTIATTLEQMGKGFINLFSNEKYSIIKQAILTNPYLFGGAGRQDSEIVNAANGKLLVKVGAGGLIVVYNILSQEVLVVKIADANMKARAIVTMEALLQLKWITQEEVDNSDWAKQNSLTIKTLNGEVVGQAEFCFSLNK